VLWLTAFTWKGFAQSTAATQIPATPQALPSVALDECLAASLAQASGLKTAKSGLDTASAQLAYSLRSDGPTLGESAGYFINSP
jgi:hypothetical protein